MPKIPWTQRRHWPNPKPGGDTVWLLRHEVGDDPNLSVKARLIELKQKANRRSVGSNGPDESSGASGMVGL